MGNPTASDLQQPLLSSSSNGTVSSAPQHEAIHVNGTAANDDPTNAWQLGSADYMASRNAELQEKIRRATYKGLGSRQFLALTKKNLILRWRNLLGTFIELAAPLIVIGICVVGWAYSLKHISHTDEFVYTEPWRITQLLDDAKSGLRPADAAVQANDTSCRNVTAQWMFCVNATTDSYKLQDVAKYDGPLPVPTLNEYLHLHHIFLDAIVNATEEGENVMDKIQRINTLADGQINNLLFMGQLWFTPATDEVQQLVQYMSETVEGFNDLDGGYRVIETEELALQQLSQMNASEHVWALVNFDSLNYTSAIDYSIRMNATAIPGTDSLRNKLLVGEDMFKRHHMYFYSGFLTLQSMVDAAIYNKTLNSTSPLPPVAPNTTHYLERRGLDLISPLNITSVPLPIPKNAVNRFYEHMGPFMGLLLSMAFLVPISLFVKNLVEERESKLREIMRCMGMFEWCYTASWVVTTTIFFTLSALFVSLLLGFTFFGHTNLLLLFIFIWLFLMAQQAFCFMISTFFRSAKVAGICTPLLMFVFTMPRYAYYNSDGNVTSLSGMTLISVFAPTCFTFGADLLNRYEHANQGLQWHNLYDDTYSFNRVLIFLCVDVVLYACLAWYFERVLPNEYGSQLPPWFMLQKSYWKPHTAAKQPRQQPSTPSKNGLKSLDIDDDSVHTADIEPVPATIAGKARVIINKLRKQYYEGFIRRKYTTAVHGLDLTFYEDQITALLGQNGAGKTTTIGMLTGLVPPTKGSFNMNNYDSLVPDSMRYMRRSMGVCAQHNTLFDTLTVREHIELFATLKNVQRRDMQRELDTIISEVGLSEKSNTYASALSGGQQRKICVAMAFVGGSKIVFLDEPTSGMDVWSRRSTWDLLKKYKQGRVIVLTTHFMDEADLLGDRIAVMAGGKLRCCGSSLFLKARYGIGYNLTLVKANKRCNAASVIDMVKSHVEESELLSAAGSEIAFQLPLRSVSHFPALFSQLEARREQMHIGGYGMSMTTLEEVFIRIVDSVEAAEEEQLISPRTSSSRSDSPVAGGRRFSHSDATLRPSSNSDAESPRSSLGPRKISTLDSVRNTPSKPHVRNNRAVSIAWDDGSKTTASRGDDAMKQLGVAGNSTYLHQIIELFRKRWLVSKRDPVGRFFELVAPVLGIVLVLAVFSIRQPSGPKIALNGQLYANTGIDWNLAAPLPINSEIQQFEPATLMQLQADPSFVVELYNSSVGGEYAPTGTEQMNSNIMSHILLNSSRHHNDNRWAALVFNDSMHLEYNVPGGYKYIDLHMPLMIMHNVSFFHALPSMMGEVAAARYNALALAQQNHTTLRGDLLPNALTPVRYTVNNHPMPYSSPPSLQERSVLSLLTAGFILIPFCYIPASFIVFLVAERTSKAKHMQFLSGVSPVIYWFTAFLWDLLSYMVVAGAVMSVLLMFGGNVYVKNSELAGATMALLTLYGAACIPLTYIYSWMYTTAGSAQVGIMGMHFLTGFVLIVASYMFQLVGGGLRQFNTNAKYFFRLFPPFNLGEGLVNIALNEISNIYYNKNTPVWSDDVIGRNIVYLAAEAAVFSFVPLLLETQVLRLISNQFQRFALFIIRYLQRKRGLVEKDIEAEDGDVYDERQRIEAHIEREPEQTLVGAIASSTAALFTPTEAEESKMNDDELKKSLLTAPAMSLQRNVSLGNTDFDNLVKIKRLRKIYPARGGRGATTTMAVKNLSLGIRRGECFGLLGVNGAGKTTTMKMMTGDILPSSGDATVNGYSILTNIAQVRREVGYCPQFDPLVELLTAYEQLSMYARFRGLPAKYINTAVDNMITRLKLKKFAHKPAGTYSGGNKRKLSLAIALIGNPSVVFLDEPSSGMDPVGRRFMWSVISSLNDANRSTILTSHSMEEVEALASRIGIMINGQLKCLGSIQHLKNKFGRGYYMEFASDERFTSDIIQFVHRHFPTAVLEESHSGRLKYQLPREKVSLASIFGIIEEHKQKLHIDDYCVSQSTLEQVFLTMCKQQQEEPMNPE